MFRSTLCVTALFLTAAGSCLPSSRSLTAGQANSEFLQAPQFPTGVEPFAVAVGDFNGDGKADVAVTARRHAKVSALLGNGDGTFQPHIEYPVADDPVAICTADLNGDGILDLAVADFGAHRVSALLGNGDGTFQPHRDYGAGTDPSFLTIADMNSDGILDVVVAGPDSVSVLLGKGDGTFQPRTYVGLNSQLTSMTVADFNKDGNDDVAAGDIDGHVSILLGAGDGTLRKFMAFYVGGVLTGMAPADLNGDGNEDLVVANGYGIAVLPGKGNGTFQPAFQTNLTGGSSQVILGDFNGDGTLDVATGSLGNAITVLLGNGGGVFQESFFEFGTGSSYFGGLAAGDFNQDLHTDLITANQTANTISLLLGNGDGSFQARVDYATASEAVAPAIGDLNGDGKPDLVVTDYGKVSGSGLFSVLLGNGDGTFQPRVDYITGPEPASLVLADFNGDGKLDVVTADYQNPGNLINVFLGNGDGTFQLRKDYPAGNDPYSMKGADLNGDGKLDLVLASGGDNAVGVLLGNGDGTFQPIVEYSTGLGPFSVDVGDLNGDGKLDLVTANFNDKTISVLLGAGDGSFPTHVEIPVGTEPGSVALGDFNRDHVLDVAVSLIHRGNTRIVTLIGNGDGTFQPPVGHGVGATPGALAIGDFNSDGNPDIAVTDFANEVDVLLGKGDGAFLPPSHYGLGSAPTTPAIGDLNGDGAPDMAIPNATVGVNTVSVLLNTGGTHISVTSSQNKSVAGQSVTFRATVSPGLSVGRPAPTGVVTFYDGTSVLGSASIVNGQAVFTTSTLTIGSHQVRAHYNGDGRCNPHDAQAITQAVR